MQDSHNTNSVPVLIAGAGPTGLALALSLARRGVAFGLIDENQGRQAVIPAPWSPTRANAGYCRNGLSCRWQHLLAEHSLKPGNAIMIDQQLVTKADDPSSSKTEEWSEWMDRDFDPKEFSVEVVNSRIAARLKSLHA